MKSPTTEEIYQSLRLLDFHCYHFSRTKKDHINFYLNDAGDSPWIRLKVHKNSARFVEGTDLTAEEKKSYYFDKYETLDDLTDDLGNFLRKYMLSFRYVRTKK